MLPVYAPKVLMDKQIQHIVIPSQESRLVGTSPSLTGAVRFCLPTLSLSFLSAPPTLICFKTRLLAMPRNSTSRIRVSQVSRFRSCCPLLHSAFPPLYHFVPRDGDSPPLALVGIRRARPRRQPPTWTFYIAFSGLAADNASKAQAEPLHQFAGNIQIPV
jgi:hypothetical protein